MPKLEPQNTHIFFIISIRRNIGKNKTHKEMPQCSIEK
ncbi:hypothetical protein ASZ90_004232 [hydrocarbon metagenome]|uniref:Uncharacterized protein n=1 Tax=hydrocarbon metagenome TaxID=938273 RepID=A0A0W8FYE8_9ZZZZ